MGELIYHALKHLVDKISDTLSSWYGIGITILLLVVNYVGEERVVFMSVLFAIFLDMIWGIAVCIKRGGFVLSYLGRETIIKLLAYMGTLFLFLNIEKSIAVGWLPVTTLIGSLIGACEFVSISANILILKPDFPFFRIFTKYLQGEISSKLGFDASEYLKIKKKKK